MLKKAIILLPAPFINGSEGLHPRGDLPHQIVHLGTCLKKYNNLDVTILDAFLKNLSIYDIIASIKKGTPQYVGIPFTITNREFSYEYILNIHNLIKEAFPNITIILFNWFYPEAFVKKLFNNPTNYSIKYLLFGDIEESFSMLIKNLERKKSLLNVPGLIFLKKTYHQTSKMHIIYHLDSLPMPDWDLIKRQEYTSMPHRHNSQNFYPMTISRGCDWNKCIYCQEYFDEKKNKRLCFRLRSPENVVTEIRLAIKKFQIQGNSI